MPTEAAAMSGPNGKHGLRTGALLRAYQRVLNRKPTSLELAAMQRAAILSARAELAASDTTCRLDDIVRIVNLARRAEAKMYDLIGHPKRRHPEVVTRYDDSAGAAIAALMREAEGQ